MKKPYAVSIITLRTIECGGQLSIEWANSKEEATGIAYKIAEEKYPVKDGWQRPEILVLECPPYQVNLGDPTP